MWWVDFFMAVGGEILHAIVLALKIAFVILIVFGCVTIGAGEDSRY